MLSAWAKVPAACAALLVNGKEGGRCPLDDSSFPPGAERTRSTSYLGARVVGGGAALGRAREEGAAASSRTHGTVVEGVAEEGAADDMAASWARSMWKWGTCGRRGQVGLLFSFL